mmetsp:Transcript_3351/g.10206  ORF Transcript_3351/g.10206 Transcript_3351/m.10206 type:complete len:184 (-) Transcript_3351:85-636(-)
MAKTICLALLVVALTACACAKSEMQWIVKTPKSTLSISPLVHTGRVRDGEVVDDSVLKSLTDSGKAIIALATDKDGEAMVKMTVRGRKREFGRFQVGVEPSGNGVDATLRANGKPARTDLLWWFGYYNTTHNRVVKIAPTTRCISVTVLTNDVVDHLEFVSNWVVTKEKVPATEGTKVTLCRA